MMQQHHRIALLVNVLAPYRVPIYRALASAYELSIFIAGHESNRSNWTDDSLSVPGARVKRSRGLTVPITKRTRGGVFDLRYLHFTPGYIADLIRFAPDAIVTNEMGFRTLVALLYGSLFRKPVWVWWGGTVHTEREIGFLRRCVRALVSCWARHWISYGASSTEYLVTLGVDRASIVQIQNCIDEAPYRTAHIRSHTWNQRPTLLCVGQLIERKGVRLLLESAARVSRTGRRFSLVFVGGGPQRSSLERYAMSAGLHNVHFIEPLAPKEMPALYRSVDALVFPTLEDVWGLVVNEAMWSGLPVFCSIYAGCASEIVPPEQRFDPLVPEDVDRSLCLAIDGHIRPADTNPLRTSASVAEQLVQAISQSLGQ